MSNTSNWKLYAIAAMVMSGVLFCGVLFLYAGQANHSTVESKEQIQQSLDELVANNGDLFSTIQLESAPKSNFVVQGERFETELFLTSSIPIDQHKDFALSINGKSLPVKDGKAKFIATADQSGTMSYIVTADITNPTTGETKELKRTFEYEVGQRAVTVQPNKMNVLFIGVDNPISITAHGVSENELKVNCSGCNIRKGGGKGNYNVTVTKPGQATISVSTPDLPPSSFMFRAKRIPDPVARISKSSGGAMGSGEFKAQGGVGAFLDNFDFDAKCRIQGYNLTHQQKRQDPIESVNGGARYNSNSKRLINQAKPGDVFYYTNVKAKCPGDRAGRKINSMVFKIK